MYKLKLWCLIFLYSYLYVRNVKRHKEKVENKYKHAGWFIIWSLDFVNSKFILKGLKHTEI